MTEFTKKEELKELVKDYKHNKQTIFNIFDFYIQENEEEILSILNKKFEHMVDIINILV